MKSSVSLVGSKLKRRLLRAGVASVACLGIGVALTTACLDRPVGEQSPRVSNIFVDQIAQTAIDKIDLLFMIDNSVSMQDKQRTLRDALPELVDRLITPTCVDGDGNLTDQRSDQEGRCPDGLQPEFTPIRDIHIGALSSSLGGYGADACPEATVDNVDGARLIASLPRGQSAVDPATARDGFLNWAPDKGGLSDANALKQDFQDLVVAVGESGCGYEASLEAWYRFLIDPEPYASVRVDLANGGRMVLEGTDTTILDQRADFLRHDSLLAIIMLSDENDCSVAAFEGSQGFYTTAAGRAPKATKVCDTDPNSACCRPCAAGDSEGCVPVAQDESCQDSVAPGFYKEDQGQGTGRDSVNLRCFKQKQRFGIDFLWDTNRYVRGLTQTTVPNRAGEDVPNPLFEAPEGQTPRTPQLVYLAGIVGVPWQDVATPESLAGETLNYLTYGQLNSEDPSTGRSRWDVILGDVNRQVEPLDPHMRESVEPRSGTHPLFDDISIVGPEVQNPQANVINGHEADYSTDRRDLQYACTYLLPEADRKDCSDPGNRAKCDCVPDDPATTTAVEDELKFNRPLCNPLPPGGPPQPTQNYAKAYPGLRQLQVLKDFGEVTTNSIVASICPKYPIRDRAPNAAYYGYTPAVAAIIARLKEAFGGKCLSRQLDVQDDKIPCKIVETTRVPDRVCEANGAPPGGCSEADGRGPVTAKLGAAVRGQLRRGARACGGTGQPACTEYCMCEILPLTNEAARETCENEAEDSLVEALQNKGYCYIDPHPAPVGQSRGSLAAIERCKETEPRRLRFAGSETPANNSITFIACVGQTGTTGLAPVDGGPVGEGGS